MRFPATPGWVSLLAVVGAPRHSWLRAPGAVPRHSWLGSAGGGGVWYVVCGVWCVVCGGGVLMGLWLVRGVVGPSPLLAEVPVCYSPPLLAGFCCRWWWVLLATPGLGPRMRFPATPGWRPLAAVVCGVWCVVCGMRRWCVGGVAAGVCCGRSSPLLAEGPGRGSPPLLAGFRCRRWWVLLATPGLGPRMRFPATPGWRPLAAVVCGVWCVVCGMRRWCVGGVAAGVCCGCSLATPGGGSCVLLPATPGWVLLPVVVGVPRHSWLRVPGAVSRHSWLGSAGGGGVRLPATPGWGPLVVVVCFAGGGVPCCVCLWCVWVCAVAVLCCVLHVCGVCVVGGVVWLCGGCVFRMCCCAWFLVCGVPVVCGLVSPPLATPGRGSRPLLAGVHWLWWWGPWVPFSLVLVCVCALCGPLCWCGWRGGGRARCGCRSCACVCLRCVVGGVCHTLVGSRRRSAWLCSKSRRREPVDV